MSLTRILGVSIVVCSLALGADLPLDLRLENLTVTPSTGPVINAWLRNRSDRPLDAMVRVRWPQGWKVDPGQQTVKLAPYSTVKAAFTIEKAVDVEANAYEICIEAEAKGQRVSRQQRVVCATAPNLKPRVDGRLDDWRDSVPITFSQGSRSTTVMTCWSRDRVCIAVRVEKPAGPRAVQFALAPGIAKAEPGKSSRYEFVVTPAGCHLLLRPGDDLKLTTEPRKLAGLECREVETMVGSEGGTDCYEIALPVKLVPELRPTPGRPFTFSLLVHDGDGAGPRDLGTVMNLWSDQRNAVSWCRWKGASFGAVLPFNNNIEFGFSSSIH